MRIFFVGQKGIPSQSGGVEKHVEDLSVKLAEKGHEVFVYTRPHYTDKNLKNYKGVELISLPTIKTKNFDAIVHTFLCCLDLIKRKPDIIHFQSIGPSSLIWLVRLLKPKVPIVATFHCQDYYHKKWGLFARFYLKIGETITCKHPDKTITVSKELTEYVGRKYEKLSVYIPNGVNKKDFKEAKEIKKWGLEKDNYIVAISRLVRHKGIQYLIDAYKQIKTDKKLVIVGGGAYTDDYVSELKKSAQGYSNIIFTDNQNGETLEELFSNAYLFVQPSEGEGLSIALLEAMAYAKACLVSDIVSNLEALGGTGLSFRNRDVNNLKEKLEYLLANPELINKYGQLAKQRVAEEYDWETIAQNTIKLYKELIVKKNKS
ncbi:MAG: glycosyltransferase family 4 protein [Planctomycetes bacterium]|nr:glycosyltransferase family 4 protein [Planctomycetota bacterium]